MSEYHVPLKPDKRFVYVSIRNYEIFNPTSFDIRNPIGKGESRLKLELMFESNDYSPDKFTEFLNAFNEFLIDFQKVVSD